MNTPIFWTKWHRGYMKALFFLYLTFFDSGQKQPKWGYILAVWERVNVRFFGKWSDTDYKSIIIKVKITNLHQPSVALLYIQKSRSLRHWSWFSFSILVSDEVYPHRLAFEASGLTMTIRLWYFSILQTRDYRLTGHIIWWLNSSICCPL